MTEDWPYDADRDHPLTARRIPVIRDSWHPRWSYEVALCIGTHLEAVEPDPAEVEVIVSLIGYRRDWYNESWQVNHLDKRPFDIDSGTNTITLLKVPDRGWLYVKRTWGHGPWPFLDNPARFTLVGILDRAFGVSTDATGPIPDRWTRWKAQFPEAFAAVPA